MGVVAFIVYIYRYAVLCFCSIFHFMFLVPFNFIFIALHIKVVVGVLSSVCCAGLHYWSVSVSFLLPVMLAAKCLRFYSFSKCSFIPALC